MKVSAMLLKEYVRSQVYLHAIQGHLPSEVVRTVRALLDFCYIAQRSALTKDDVSQLKDTLSRFHQYREVFITSGVRDNFLVPRQYALVHFPSLIRLFGAPNGLCSSITESKHIRAVKEPW